MEQLSQAAVRQLLARARSGADGQREPGPDGPRTWINPAINPATNPAADRPAGPSLSFRVAPAVAEPSSVERRLVRRAEALWARLAGTEPLPSAKQADELLRPPFAAQGLLVEMPAGSSAALSFVGDSLALLTRLSPGSADEAGAATRLGGRLLALARRAATLGQPCVYDSDEDRATAGPHGADTQLLMRAIALPLAGVRGAEMGTTAVVVASWRKLLSVEETRALHRELEAAIDWMHRQGS